MKSIRRLLILTLCIAMACSTVTASATQVTVGAGTGGGTSLTPPDGITQSLAPANISINVKDADVRDVLSAVAVNMGYSIIYKGEVSTISVKIENLPPAAAFDYLLKILNMASLKDGNTLIVGTKETLTQDFKRSLSLTSFQLKYIKADVIAQQLGVLGIPVTVLSLNANPYTLWVQGFPTDVAKVGELVNIMDIYANEDVSANTPGGQTAKNIYRVELKYLSATQFNAFLKTLGINCGLPLSDDRETLWFYATVAERDTIMNIRSKVDRSYVNIDTVGNNGIIFKVLNTQTVSKDTILSAIQAVVPKLQLVSVGNRTTAILAVGLKEDIERAEQLITDLEKSLGGSNALYTTFTRYDLKNITAKEAEARLKNVRFGDTVGFYTTPYAEFSNTIFAYCSPDYKNVVITLLDQIDSAAKKIRIPIFQSGTAAKLAEVENTLKVLLEYQLGTMAASAVTFGRTGTLLYVDCPPEAARMVEDMLGKMGEIETDEAKAADLSVTAYLAANPGAQTPIGTPTGSPQWAAYGQWVSAQIAKGGRSGRGALVPPGASSIGPAPIVIPGRTPGQQLLADAEGELNSHLAAYPITIAVTDDASAKATLTLLLDEAQHFLANSPRYSTVTFDRPTVTYMYLPATPTAEGRYTMNLELSSTTEPMLAKECTLVLALPKTSLAP